MNTVPVLFSVCYSLSVAVELVAVTCSCIECGRMAEGRSIDYLWKERQFLSLLKGRVRSLFLRCGCG